MARWWQTVRPLGLRQVAARLRLILLRRWWRLTRRSVSGRRPVEWVRGPGGAAVVDPALLAPEAAEARAALQAVTANTFLFLAEERRFPLDLDWHVTEASHLWRYHLHYFGYVRELMLADAIGGRDGAIQFQRLTASWIAGNRAVRGDGWHPYTLSLRIVNWLKAAAFWEDQLVQPADWRRDFSASLRDQAEHLLLQLEHDVRGNHLFENGRALVWLGLVTGGSDARRWLERGLQILAHEVPAQLLADGCHFERCPGYHFSVLLSLVELGSLFELQGSPVPSWLEVAVRQMRGFGAAILLPDGTYPLLKDSARDQVAIGPAAVLDCAGRWLDCSAAGSSRAGALRTILYFGRSGPVHVPPPMLSTTSGYCISRTADEAVVFDGVSRARPIFRPMHTPTL